MTGKAAEEHHADVFIHMHRRVRDDTRPQTRVSILGFGRQYTSMKRPHLWFKDRWNLWFGLVFECLDWFSVVNTADFVES